MGSRDAGDGCRSSSDCTCSPGTGGNYQDVHKDRVRRAELYGWRAESYGWSADHHGGMVIIYGSESLPLASPSLNGLFIGTCRERPWPIPSLEELEHLYSSLTPEERDELLQCLLIAAARGGEAMLKTLEDYLLCIASKTFIDSLPEESQPPFHWPITDVGANGAMRQGRVHP